MAAYVRSATNAVRSSGSGTSVNAPQPSPSSGDLVLVFMLFNGGTGVSITPPADFTLTARDDSTTDIGLAIYEGIAPIASYTFTITDEDFTIGTMAVADAHQLDAVFSSSIEDAASSTLSVAPAASGLKNSLLVSAFGVNAATTWTGPSDMVEQMDTGQVGNPTLA